MSISNGTNSPPPPRDPRSLLVRLTPDSYQHLQLLQARLRFLHRMEAELSEEPAGRDPYSLSGVVTWLLAQAKGPLRQRERRVGRRLKARHLRESEKPATDLPPAPLGG
jgi:hypothetical protein